MVILTDAGSLSQIGHPGIKELLSLRLHQLQSPDVPDEFDACQATFILVEGGDAVSEIEQATGFPILTSLFDDLPFDHPDFYPPFEIMEEHTYEQHRFYEMVFIGNDDGAATALFVPDEEGINRDLLAVCRSFCTPALNDHA